MTNPADDYESFQPKVKKQFHFILNKELTNDILSYPNMHIDIFYDTIWDKFHEDQQNKRHINSPKGVPNKDKVKKDKNEANLTPFQIYVKTQSKLRKDEFKNTPKNVKNKVFAHEWHKLTEDEKQRVINENGKFSK